MKKIITILILFVLSFFFLSCGNEREESVDLTPTMEEIKNNIPSSFEEDLLLPSVDGFDVSYSITGTTIEDGYVIYKSLGYDYNCLLSITVSKGNSTISDSISITMIYDENKEKTKAVNLMNPYLDSFVDLLPTKISSNFKLPTKDEISLPSDMTLVTKVETTMVTANKVYQYNFPTEQENFKLEIRISYNGFTVSKTLNIPVVSGEEFNKVPRIYLSTTDNVEITKDDYVTGTFTLKEKGDNGEWQTTNDELSMKIKGRGNSTWGFKKKPYKIKFNEKVALLGEKKAKTWTLIANYIDHSLLRNYAAYYLGRSLDGLSHTTCAHFVDVYLNGKYVGNYLLCEQTEIDKNRLNITDDDTKVDTGYLVEMDQKFFESNEGEEGKEFFYLTMFGKQWLMAMNTPDPEDSKIISDQIAYIKKYYEDLIKLMEKNDDKMFDYLDINSAVDSFIVQEITKNKDQGWSSFFMHKDVGGKLCFGPIWDFDLSSLAQGNISSSERSAKGWYTDTGYYNPFYKYLLKNNTFKKALKARWNEIFKVEIADFINEISRAKDYIRYSAIQNFKVWDVIGKETGWWISEEEHNVTTWEGQVDLLINYYKDRVKWMNTEINKF